VDETRLTPEEWAEAARIGKIARDGGLDALSVADLELLECLVRTVACEEVGSFLG
jgi:hypothetical protein